MDSYRLNGSSDCPISMANIHIGITDLTAACQEILSDAFRQMKNRSSWDLNCPVVVLDARNQPPRQVQIGVGGVGGVVPVSTAIEDPLIREWLELSAELDQPEDAQKQMLDRFGQDFEDSYTNFQEEKIQKGGCLIGTDDLTKFVHQSRSVFPDQIAVLAVLPGLKDYQWSVEQFSWKPD